MLGNDYVWRPARREDIPAIHKLLLAVDQTDGNETAGTVEDMEREFGDPWSDPMTDSLLGLTADGQVAAFARVFVNPRPEGEYRAYLEVEIHPRHRRAGLEELTLSWLESRAQQRLEELPASLPRIMRLGCLDHLHDRITLYQGHGYQPVRRFFRMRRDLGQEMPEGPLPQGLTLRAYGPELERACLKAFNESFSENWAYESTTIEDWRMFFTGSSGFRPDLTLLAMEGDQIAGFSLNYVNREENERLGFQRGWIGQLGVLRPWRRRGVASALLCETMRAFKAEGLQYAALGVDAENQTGALGIYERLGFEAVKRFVAFARPV